MRVILPQRSALDLSPPDNEMRPKSRSFLLMKHGRTPWKCLVLFAMAVACIPAFGLRLPAASPESVGLSSQRLERIGAVIQKSIDEGRPAGAATLVARHGKVAWFEAQGMADKENGKPMTSEAPCALNTKQGCGGRLPFGRWGSNFVTLWSSRRTRYRLIGVHHEEDYLDGRCGWIGDSIAAALVWMGGESCKMHLPCLSKFLSEHSIFGCEIGDHVLLPTIHPTRENQKHQLPRLQKSLHRFLTDAP